MVEVQYAEPARRRDNRGGRTSRHPAGFLTIRQVSEWLGVTRKTVYEMIRDGRFEPPIKINDRGNVRFRPGAIERWEARCAEVEPAGTEKGHERK